MENRSTGQPALSLSLVACYICRCKRSASASIRGSTGAADVYEADIIATISTEQVQVWGRKKRHNGVRDCRCVHADEGAGGKSRL
ncbi:hypothetical protein WG66_014402 [Moniliophthora roreri]|nr:hypothetical protein WG66_014402 [Moniliophthora roreri]